MDRDRSGPMEHPDDYVTASYLDGALPPRERDRVEAHLSICAVCRDGVTLLAAVVNAADRPTARDELAPPGILAESRARALAGGRTSRGMAAAAALLMVAITAATFRLPGEPLIEPVVYRAAGGQSVVNLRPAEEMVVSREDLVFSWDPVPGADRYVVSVVGQDDLTVTITAQIGRTAVGWPAGLPAPRPGPLVWKVKALALDRVLAESRSIAFEVN